MQLCAYDRRQNKTDHHLISAFQLKINVHWLKLDMNLLIENACLTSNKYFEQNRKIKLHNVIVYKNKLFKKHCSKRDELIIL